MPSRSRLRPKFHVLLWLLLGLGLVLLVSARIGVFSLSELVAMPDGDRWLPSALASVDHPFHIVRAETLRRALLDGELLRWIGHHQGGYPIDFYPLGVAWLEVAVWGLTIGMFSIPQVHTIVVALIFLAPGLAFLLLARQDGWGGGVAVIALTLHVVVPGDWWHGGYTELVQWGLLTNVGGAVAALFCLAFLSRYVDSGAGLAAAGAALAAAGAIYANPRSLIALAAVGVGVWVTAALRSGNDGRSAGLAAVRVAQVGAVAGLLAAPELLSLARFSGLYQFVRYEHYADLGAFLTSSVTAVSGPVIGLAVAGVVLTGFRRQLVAARSVAVTGLLYALITILLIGGAGNALAQLEPTRLMPFQRLLVVYLAAVTIVAAARWAARGLTGWARVVPDLAMALLVVALVVLRLGFGPNVSMPIPAQTDPLAPALYPTERSAAPQQADFEAAIRQADAEAEPGTAILVVGSALSWHQRLWAPLWTDRPLIYDNWLWYWHDDHAGTPGYTWELGNHYPDADRVLERAFLDQHGIGAVVVTGPVADLAAMDPGLEPRRDGTYRLFLVRDPTTIVTFAETNAAQSTFSPAAITASGEGGAGGAIIRRNWFPRWQANVNGEPASVTRLDDGYMHVPVPMGPVTLTLRYEADAIDWIGRILAAIGGIAVVTVAVRARRRPSVAV